MRSLTWTQCAQFIVVMLGIAVPLIAISVLVTNLPLPQLAYGGILDDMTQLEAGARADGRAAPSLGARAARRRSARR